jgi:hypothetical protein
MFKPYTMWDHLFKAYKSRNTGWILLLTLNTGNLEIICFIIIIIAAGAIGFCHRYVPHQFCALVVIVCL